MGHEQATQHLTLSPPVTSGIILGVHPANTFVAGLCASWEGGLAGRRSAALHPGRRARWQIARLAPPHLKFRRKAFACTGRLARRHHVAVANPGRTPSGEDCRGRAFSFETPIVSTTRLLVRARASRRRTGRSDRSDPSWRRPGCPRGPACRPKPQRPASGRHVGPLVAGVSRDGSRWNTACPPAAGRRAGLLRCGRKPNALPLFESRTQTRNAIDADLLSEADKAEGVSTRRRPGPRTAGTAFADSCDMRPRRSGRTPLGTAV